MAKHKITLTKSTTEDKLLRAVRRDKKSRSKRDRPESVDELVSAISNIRLDGRTRHAQHLVSVRKALSDTPVETTLALVRDLLATHSIIMRQLIAEVSRPGFEVLDEQGSLHPVLARHLPDTQKSILSTAQTLLRLEGALHPPARAVKGGADDPGESASPSISDIILSLSDG